MRVFVTGSQGRIGQVVAEELCSEGYDLRTLDGGAQRGQKWEHVPGDVRDGYLVRRLMMGCDAVVHLAGIPGDNRGQIDHIFDVNVMGTWHILEAAAEAGVSKVINFSSIQALGMGNDKFDPAWLPISEQYPATPQPTYGLTKHLGEELCGHFSRIFGMTTFSLRPTTVMLPFAYNRWKRGNRTMLWGNMRSNAFSYVDVRDVSSIVSLALKHPEDGTAKQYMIAARDHCADLPTDELVKNEFPNARWIAPPSYLENPYRSLIDTQAAENDLNWLPRYSWRDEVEE